MNIIDLTRQSMGWNNPPSTRNQSQIRRLGIHHSATATGSQRIFENHWRNLNWRVGGYHEIILPNGDVEICYVPTTIVNGVGGHNADTYHIAMVGNFRINGAQPTARQLKSFLERVRFNLNRFNIPRASVLGHNEFANTPNFNNRANICPGLNMNNIRDQLRLPNPAPTPENPVHVVRAGENLTGIARMHNTTVAELVRLNNIVNEDVIRIGQIIQLPSNSTASLPRITIEQLARQVIADQWGNGDERVRRLRAAGHDAQVVQQRVNQILR